MAFSYFEDFVAASTAKSTIFELLKSFRFVGEMLFGIFSQSNTLSVFLINNPEKLFWLIENETMTYTKCVNDFKKELMELILKTDNYNKRRYYLRYYRKNEYLRIASREIVKACAFQETMKELSDLAKASIEAALFIAKDKLKVRYGDINGGFCVIGMGKLGNRELNFSSDIDLLFVHSDESNGEYFNKLAQEIVSILNDTSEGGFVYRVDMRLRPGGRTSALSMSLDEYENYYSTFGQLWEKMALVKAYPAAGDIELGKEFLNILEPFVFRKSIDIEYIKEIRSLMFKIKKYSKKSVDCKRIPPDRLDIKKGLGGIREIEFITNYFQLIYGGKKPYLKHRDTLSCIEILKTEGLLDKQDADILSLSYLFFRVIEHKIQLLNEQQTQQLPTAPKELLRLAKSLSMDLDGFVDKYLSYSDRVHIIFRRIFIEDDKFPVFSSDEDIEGYLNEYGIENAASVCVLIKDAVKKFLANDIKRSTIEDIFDFTFKRVNHKFFENCIKGYNTVDPTYTSLLFGSRQLFEAFVRLLSADLSVKLSKHIDLIDDFISGEPLNYRELSVNEFERLSLSVIFRLYLEPYNLTAAKILSDFAVDFIQKTVSAYDKDNALAVVGYGKLAASELFVGSDLDIVFVAKENAYMYVDTVQKIAKKLKEIFDVDLRLRPYGDKGSIVVDLEYLESYFAKSALPWEKQAAQKSKIVYCGFENGLLNGVYDRFILDNPPTRADILDMKKKIEKTKGQEYDIKSFRGGISDIEFLSQALCFENGCIKRSLSAIELLDLIEKTGLMDTKRLKEAYIFYMSVLNIFRTFKRGSIIDNFDDIEFFMQEKDIKKQIESYRKIVADSFDKVFL